MVSYEGRNDYATRLAGHYIGKGLSLEEVRCIMRAWDAQNVDQLGDELETCVDNIWNKYLARDANPDAKIETHLKSTADLQHKEFKPLRFTVPLYLPEGLGLLFAKPKWGKSWLLLNTYMAVSSGGTCLGQTCEQGDALLLALEDSDSRLKRRIEKLRGYGPWPTFDYTTTWNRFDDGGLDMLEQWIKSRKNPRLIGVDIFQRVRRLIRGKEPTYRADYEAPVQLHDLADEYRITIIATHHRRKAESDDPMDTASGI
jgi:AAA domain